MLGGSEIEAQRVSAALQERGHRVKILCAGGDPMPPLTHWVDPCGVSVQLIGGRWPPRLRGYVFALGVAWTLWKERHNYQIAYFVMQGLQLATGLPVAGVLRKSIVMKFSGSGLITQMTKSFLGRLELRFLRKWASRVLVLNPGMEQEAKDAGLDSQRLGWMPNPVDTDVFYPCSSSEREQRRSELNIYPGTLLVVFIGRFHTEKELPGLLRAFRLVVNERPRAILALVGDGPLRAQIVQLARELDLERHVILTGRLDAAGVLKWLHVSDVFTLVSALEGFPCSLIEAMSAGLPALVSDIPANTQLIETEIHGLVTPLGNLEAIAGGLIRLLDDAELRARLGVAGRRRILEHYTTPHIVSCYETLFREVLAS
jgi:glycosyltransferase involved in cell wall biosynthesis